MKKNLMIMLIGLVIVTALNAEENSGDKAIRPVLYAGAGTTQLDGQAILSLNARLTLELYDWLEIGIQGDVYHSLERTYTDEQGRAYQAESGSSGLFVHSGWTILQNLKAGLALATGTQMIQLRYSGELRDQMTWTEEVPDQLLLAYNSIALTLEYSLCPVHSLFLETGYRHVHPFSTPYLENEAATGGVFASLYYGAQL